MRLSLEDRATGWTLSELKRFRDERAALLCQRTNELHRLRRQLLELYGWVLAPKTPLKPKTVEAYKMVLAAHGCPLEESKADPSPAPGLDYSI